MADGESPIQACYRILWWYRDWWWIYHRIVIAGSVTGCFQYTSYGLQVVYSWEWWLSYCKYWISYFSMLWRSTIIILKWEMYFLLLFLLTSPIFCFLNKPYKLSGNNFVLLFPILASKCAGDGWVGTQSTYIWCFKYAAECQPLWCLL